MIIGWFVFLIWFISFALCMWLERSKLTCIRESSDRSMVILFVISGLALAPILLVQLLVERVFTRMRVEDRKALNRLR